jgi:hypothetical protein
LAARAADESGFNPDVAESMSRKAAFTRFKPHDFRDPEAARPGRA